MITDIDSFSMCVNFKFKLLISCNFTQKEFIAYGLCIWRSVGMLDFIINQNELAALCGLPHIQQLTYLRGIRPYMDVKTGLVGAKRRISHQSISEQLYIEPHPGIKSQSFSRDQVRRAIAGLVRAGALVVHSEDMHLILKCGLATLGYSAQKKPP